MPTPLVIEHGPRKGALLGIGGSDAPVIMGLSPWSSPAELWAVRSGIIPKPERSSPAMTWGTILEEPVIRTYAEQTGRRVRRPKGAITHQSYPWMYGHVDGLATGRRVVEAKTSRSDSGWGDPPDGDIPPMYYCQVQHYLAVTGYGVADVPVLFAGSDFRIFTVPRDHGYIDHLIEREEAFLEAVRTGTEPDLDGSEATAAYVRARYPADVGVEVSATAEQEALVRAYLAAKAEREAADAREREAASRIQSVMGEARTMYGGGFKVSWPTIARKGSVDWEAVAKAYRAIIADRDPGLAGALDTIQSVHTGEPSSYRRFTVQQR